MDDCRFGKKNTICLFCKSRISRGNRESLQDGSTFYLYTDNKEMLRKKRKQLKANFSDYSTIILHFYSFAYQKLSVSIGIGTPYDSLHAFQVLCDTIKWSNLMESNLFLLCYH